MKDYACERVYRDARITSIYEGTTQLQVVAAIRHVTTGTYSAIIKEMADAEYPERLAAFKPMLEDLTAKYEAAVAKVTEAADTRYTDFMARRLVEMAGNIVMSYLLLQDAAADESFDKTLTVYTKMAQAEVARHIEFIENFDKAQLEAYNV